MAAQSELSRTYRKFWLAFEVSDAKLALFRVIFFAVFAIDAWSQIAHAPRYGFRDFNVGHFPFLDGLLPMPTRSTMVLIYGAQTYLALRILLGGVGRTLYVALALLFAYGYFISQLNSYQHHYLLAIALALVAAFPLGSAPAGQSKPQARARNWPVRMLLVAISVMYLFAALSKADPEWLNGSALQAQLPDGRLREIAKSMGWGFTAKLTLFTELVLVFAIQWRRAWPFALVTGIGMHMMFHWAGLKIGLFSYFMVSLYVLLLPEPWVERGRALSMKAGTRMRPVRDWLDKPGVLAWLLCAVGLAAGLVLVQMLPIDGFNALTICIALLAGAELATRWRRAGAAGLQHLLACALLVLLAGHTDALRDYYRFWGGQERRAGNHFESMLAYEKVVKVAPDYLPGRRSLAAQYRRLGHEDDALSQCEAGLAIDATDLVLNRTAAEIYSAQGEGNEALAAAERGLQTSPNDPKLRAIRKRWQRELNSHAPQ